MDQCCAPDLDPTPASRGLRVVLWTALAANAAMFLIEVVAGFVVGSVSLQADALDFLSDAANYGVSLFVLGMSVPRRALAALIKAVSMGLVGLWVVAAAISNALTQTVPEPAAMTAVGIAALGVNFGVAAMLFRWRSGDANLRSVWLCTRNDVIGNLAVLLAAAGVFGTGTGWPDLLVAAIIAALALSAAARIARHAVLELRPVGL